MKIIALLVYFVIIPIGIAKCQINGIYSIDNISESIDCNLYLYKGGTYYIELYEDVTDDISMSLILSCGKYKINNNRIFLIDKVHNFTTEIIREKSKIKVVKSFKFLIDKQFNFYGNHDDKETNIIDPTINTFKLYEKRKQYKLSHKKIIPLDIGVYTDGQGYNLTIQQSNKYKLEYKNLFISEGEWRRDGNELELKDVYLKQSFYALIDYKALISSLLLGEYRGIKLILLVRKGK